MITTMEKFRHSVIATERCELPSGKHTKNYGKSPYLIGKSTIKWAMFNSYVKLPEGIDILLSPLSMFTS